jgi:hypothetical protein
MRLLYFSPLLLIVACASTSVSSEVSTDGTMSSPTTGAQVKVVLASARLGDERCTHDESQDVGTKSCTQPPPTPRGTGMCGEPCVFSNVQLDFSATATGRTSHVQIVSVSLIDATSGAEVQKLSAYTPLDWNGTAYVPWDENVPSGTEVKASYTLSPPTWSQIDPTNTFRHQYFYRIEVGLDGARTVLDSQAMTKDPPVAT